MPFTPLFFKRGVRLCEVRVCFVLLLTSSLVTSSPSFGQAQSVPPQVTAPASPAITVSKSAEGPSESQSATTSMSLSAPGGIGGTALPSSMAAANGDYVLRPGDVIEMIVYREPDLSIRSKIGKDGEVQMPLLGEIKLSGMSVRNATKLIHDQYNADYLVDPQIYLNIAAYNTNKFTIIGQVGKPGTYEFSGSDPLGMLEAIGMAGGFTRIADRGHVIVKRREGGKVRTIKVNAKKLADSGVDRFEIQSGDVIDVGESWY
jgi:polysaccharide export outer membrane protein